MMNDEASYHIRYHQPTSTLPLATHSFFSPVTCGLCYQADEYIIPPSQYTVGIALNRQCNLLSLNQRSNYVKKGMENRIL